MKKPSILLVEADDTLRRNLRGLLLRWGCEVIEAFDKSTSLCQLQASNPDLVIAGSPRDEPGEALGLAQEIRRRDRRVPLIFITLNSSEELVIAALRAGVTDYLRYPVSFEELFASIDRCLATVPPAILHQSS